MSELFKRLFIKNYDDVTNPKVRERYGTSAGVLGIIGNVILFCAKLVVGLLSMSIAVVADAINNLSDFMTSIITLIGFKLAGRPADKEHPYGHSRIEYVTGFIIAFVILFLGIEIGRNAIDKIITASPTDFSIVTCVILALSIVVKLCLSIIFKGLAKSINSDTLHAMSTDSRNDVISTAVVLLSAILALCLGIQIDGYLGVIVALFIIYSAIKLIKETVNTLIGTPPDKEFVDCVVEKLKSYPEVLDIHDLVIHNYGPLKTFASVHIEVDARVDIMISHELADNIERDFIKNMNVMMVCHLDPVAIGDPETDKLRTLMADTLKRLDERLTLHDLRIVHAVSFSNVIFDVVLPFDCNYTEYDVKQEVSKALKTLSKPYFAVIEFDKNYNA